MSAGFRGGAIPPPSSGPSIADVAREVVRLAEPELRERVRLQGFDPDGPWPQYRCLTHGHGYGRCPCDAGPDDDASPFRTLPRSGRRLGEWAPGGE